MLWSVIPEDVVLAGLNEASEVLEGRVGRCDCRLRRGKDGVCTVERLMSTNPADYLRAELAPGNRIWVR